MYILAADTSTNCCSVAVSCDSKVVSETILDVKSTHSKHLLTLVNQTLLNADIELKDIELFSVASGPGSFTGLRIGMSAFKGMALSLDKPLITISSLELLSEQTTFHTDYLCPLIDARKNEFYYSLYRNNNGKPEKIISENVASIENILDSIDKSCTFTGNGVDICKDEIKVNNKSFQFTKFHERQIRSSVLTELAYKKYIQKNVNELVKSTPLYIRKSDAELNLSK